MEKEKILSEIGERLGETSFSQRTLGLYVDLTPVDEPDEAYYERAVGFLKGMQGQYDHDVATKVDDFKKNYKPMPPKREEDADAEPKPNKEVEEMRASLQAIQERLENAEKQERQREILKKVREGMRSHNAKDDYVLRKTLQGVVFDEKKELSDIVKEQLARYDEEYKACRGQGVTPRSTLHGGGGESDAVSQFFARKAKKEGWTHASK